MALKMSIEVTGDKQLVAKLKRLGVDLQDYTEAMKKIGKALAEYYSGPAFLSQGGVFGAKWPRLSPAYQEYKIKHYRTFANSILVRGVGGDSMQNEFTYTPSKKGVIISNKASYFKYHQSTLARHKLPRRQMMGVNSAIETIIRDLLNADIKAKLEKA